MFCDPREPLDELALRACNLGTKTETCAAFVLACLQKRKTLDGIPIPQWYGKVEAAQFVLDYKQQLLSVQPAYERLLGNWPHRARRIGEVIVSLRIMPVGGDPDDDRNWSVLHFISQENRNSGVGFRVDLAAFDEPPRMHVLRELRKAGHSGRRSIRVIGFTPTIRSQWADIREDFGDLGIVWRRRIRRIDRDRAEVRWSLDDVAVWILSDERKAALRRAYELDPLKDAREHGDYTNAEGACPFHVLTLQDMLAKCVEPEIFEWNVRREADDADGRTFSVATVPVQVWWGGPRADATSSFSHRYYVPVDPSSGINDWKHDPGGILVTQQVTGRLEARFNGYLGSYGLGVLGAGLGRQYNTAPVDPENNAGWIEGVLRGLRDSHYPNIARERRLTTQDGEFQQRWGFSTTFETRSAMVAAIQAWISAWAAGKPYAPCPSADVIQCLLDCILDERGKPVAAPGFHDEDMILWGQSLRRRAAGTGLAMPLAQGRPYKSPERQLIEAVRGPEKRPTPGPEGRLAGLRRRRGV